LPGYAEGAWWVQDAAAALPARALAARPGERVLDLCAAPGGKTLQLAATGAEVTALDVSDARLGRLRDNLARTGLAARIVTADALQWAPPAPFDAILLDAPCSATGTLRRHPDLPFVRTAEDLKPLATIQSALLERATGWLRPGGRLVFCTCSLLPEEGETVLAAALARHPDLVPDPAALEAVPGLESEWDAGPGALRITPETWEERAGLDGFYIAALRREP
jgi:16S rRNA (cytosine967-C5)-methyltransferase